MQVEEEQVSGLLLPRRRGDGFRPFDQRPHVHKNRRVESNAHGTKTAPWLPDAVRRPWVQMAFLVGRDHIRHRILTSQIAAAAARNAKSIINRRGSAM